MATMGRRPTVNINLPTRMRARKKPGGIYYYYDTGGKPRKEIPLGRNYTEAIIKWGQLEGDAIKRAAKMITLKHAIDTYIEKVLPSKASRTQADNLKEFEWLLKFFNAPPAPIDEIRPLHVRQYLDWRTKDGTSFSRANRERALLSHVWNKAREWGITDRENPCKGVTGFSEKGRRDVYIEDDVFMAVYQHADQPLKDALDLAYLTGQRPADVRKMSETDIADGAISVQQNKTGKRLRIKIEGQLEQLIERIRGRKKQHAVHSLALIINERGQRLGDQAFRDRFDKARDAACRHNPKLAADIKKFQFRDLRAKAGTDKQNIEEAQKLLGHESVVMTQHYVRNRKGDLVSPTR